MRPLNCGSVKRMLAGLLLLPLSLSLTSCASVGTALPWSPCEHPLIDPRTDQGVAQGLLAYQREIDRCNAMNGYGEVE